MHVPHCSQQTSCSSTGAACIASLLQLAIACAYSPALLNFLLQTSCSSTGVVCSAPILLYDSPTHLLAHTPCLCSVADFLLINWCSVQRIMRRCGVMPEERVEALDALGFDWTGADPLS